MKIQINREHILFSSTIHLENLFSDTTPPPPSRSLIEDIAWESSSHVISPAERVVGQQMVSLGIWDLLGQTTRLSPVSTISTRSY